MRTHKVKRISDLNGKYGIEEELNQMEKKYVGFSVESIIPGNTIGTYLNGFYLVFSYDCLRSPEEQEY